MSDEEDYMSDAILKQIPDTRPGLLPKNAARIQEQKKKEKVANAKNKQKPKAVLEKEKRDEGLGVAISSANKGFSLLQKMGYKPGMAIGKSGIGRTEPVPVEIKTGRGGLGRESYQKHRKEEQIQKYRNMSAKRQKMEIENKQTFMRRMNEKMSRKNIEKDLYKSQKVCEQLDSQMGIAVPHEAFFWPEVLRPKSDTCEPLEEPLDRLEAGYSGYVQDEESEEENIDEEDDNATHYTVEDQLDVLTLYLRTKHKYCVWCGTKYEDKDDLNQNCPGNSAELHEDL